MLQYGCPDLEFFGPRPADQQISEPDIISRTLRILIAQHSYRQFVFAGAQPAGDDACAELWGAAISIDAAERRRGGLAVDQAFDDSAVGSRAVRDAYDRPVEIVFDLRSGAVAHEQFGRQRAVVADFDPPVRAALSCGSSLRFDFDNGFEFAVIHLIADERRRKVTQDRRRFELLLLGQEGGDEVGVEFVAGVGRSYAVLQ